MIRSSLKSGLKKMLGLVPPPPAPAPPAPAWRAESAPAYPKQANAPAPADPVVAAPVEPIVAAIVAAIVEPTPVVLAPIEPVIEAAPVAPAPVAPAAAQTDVVGTALTMEALQEIMDEMVRPALQGDGGDITLIKVENNDVYVKLVGSCSTCPSSIMTMKLGVEALLKEEFPSMGQLIQVD